MAEKEPPDHMSSQEPPTSVPSGETTARHSPEGDPVADPPLPHASPDETRRLLETFLNGEYAVRPRQVPWPLDRQTMLDYFQERVETRPLGLTEAAKLPLLAEVYLLRELAPLIRTPLARRERSADEVRLSAALCRTIGAVGPANDVAFAADYYRYLVPLASAQEALLDLIPARDALGPHVTSQALGEAMARRAGALAHSQSLDDQMAGRELEETKENTLQDIDWADAARRRVLAAEDPAKRLRLLMDIYFQRTTDGGMDYLMGWTVLLIRRHAQQQGRQAVVSQLRTELASVDKAVEPGNSRQDDPDTLFASIRALRGLIYFGQKLGEDDEVYFEEYASNQMDMLSVEWLMPQRYNMAQYG